MITTLELYLRDQVIRGELKNETGRRAVDLLNEPAGGMIVLNDAWSGSTYAEGPPVKLGTVRVQRSHVLFAIPHDVAPQLPKQLRSNFVEKRPVPVAVGAGPFLIVGMMHVGRYDLPSLDPGVNESKGRAFVPLTGAHLTSQHTPGQSLDVGVVLLNRTAISYTYSPPTP